MCVLYSLITDNSLAYIELSAGRESVLSVLVIASENKQSSLIKEHPSVTEPCVIPRFPFQDSILFSLFLQVADEQILISAVQISVMYDGFQLLRNG